MKQIGRIRDGIRRFCNEHDRMSRSFGKSVKKAVKAQREAGLPVARYDAERKAPYFEYPDGRREYDLSRPICPAASDADAEAGRGKMNVKEFILSTPQQSLMEHFAVLDSMLQLTVQQREMDLEPFLAEIEATEPIAGDNVVIGYHYINHEEEVWDILVYDKENLLSVTDPFPQLAGVQDVDRLSEEALEAIDFSAFAYEGHTFEFTPRETILGYEVCLANLDKREQIGFCLQLILGMTFLGGVPEQGRTKEQRR